MKQDVFSSRLPHPARLSVRAILPFILAIIVILPGCTWLGHTASPTADTQPSPTSPPFGGSLRVRLATDPATLNPLIAGTDKSSQTVADLVFSGLTRLDNRLRPVPDLAETWEIAPDGLTITFHLRRNVKWHDGADFTSLDVLFTYDTLRKLQPVTSFQTTLEEVVESVDAPDEHTVKLALRKRYAPILAELAFPIVPEHILARVSLTDLPNYAQFNRHPIGTGPFRFAQWYSSGALVLDAFEGYYGGRPNLDSVVFLVTPDSATAAEAIGQGDLDLAELSGTEFQSLTSSPPLSRTLRFEVQPEMGFNYVAFNLRPGRPFSDRRLRQAWALALDKRALVEEATGGAGIAVWSDIPIASWAHDGATVEMERDSSGARALLHEAGWTDSDGDGVVDKDGQALSVALYVRQDDEARLRAAYLLSKQLREIGIQVFVAPADFETTLLSKRSYPNDFDVMVMGWSDLPSDPDNYYLFHSSQIPTPAAPWLHNYTGLSDSELDQLILSARGLYDLDKRAKLYSSVQQTVARLLPYYFLWAEKRYFVLDGSFQGDIDLQSPNYLWNVEAWYRVGA